MNKKKGISIATKYNQITKVHVFYTLFTKKQYNCNKEQRK